jgi:putative ABC transport system ATP-binding protein
MRLNGEVVYDDGWLRRHLRRLRLEKIGFIFQTHNQPHNLLPFLTAAENVMEVMELAGAAPHRLVPETPACWTI